MHHFTGADLLYLAAAADAVIALLTIRWLRNAPMPTTDAARALRRGRWMMVGALCASVIAFCLMAVFMHAAREPIF
ncbi:MAG TPA: hypothetical protein VFW19_08175 [Allosphingosinicella sp.]|nr:hypothetical protein [Allosphingosinicella sp.]